MVHRIRTLAGKAAGKHKEFAGRRATS